MRKIRIQNKTYQIPTEWNDISVDSFLTISLAGDRMPDKLRAILFPKEGEETPELTGKDNEEFLRFKIDFCHEVTGIEKDLLKQIDLGGTETTWGLLDLFECLSRFLAMPDEKEFDVVEFFELDGVEYGCNAKGLDFLGNNKPFKNGSFNEFKEANEILANFNKIGKGEFGGLHYLLAILYRPVLRKYKWFGPKKVVPFTDDTFRARADRMQKLDMATAWGMYFFLSHSLTTRAQHMVQSLKNQSLNQGKQRSALTLLHRIRGIFSKKTLQNSVYLILTALVLL